MEVTAKTQYAQTAKKGFRSDTEADSVGGANATHIFGTTVVESPESLKQISSKGENFAATEQSGQDQGFVHLFLDFSGRHLSPKMVFNAPNAAVEELVLL